MAIPDYPRVKSLKLRNFKGIAELDIEFDESLTLLAGVNGAGKTSVLQALLAAVTDAWRTHALLSRGIVVFPTFRFPGSVRRVGKSEPQVSLEFTITGRPPVEAQFTVGEQNRDLNLVDPRPFLDFLKATTSPLPLVVYYEQNRVFSSNDTMWSVTVSSGKNRESSLNTTISSPSEFKSWFFEKEADEGQEVRERGDLSYEDPELANVRRLLDQLDGFTAVRSRKNPDSSERTLFLEKEGANIPFDSLSGGEQAFFMLAADLARRLMLASPEKPVAEAPAIVCIDEIELHLHPAWQRRILKTLMETFPACQFVVTTHSPQVIGGVEARHVRLLTPAEDGTRKAEQPMASKGRDSNYILKGILDTPEREDGIDALFVECDRLLDEGRLKEAEKALHKLDHAVEGQSSAVATRQAKLNRLRRAAE